jgi:hypothetical protein
LYSAFNGGEFEGEVVLFPLHAEGEEPSVLEKTRKMLVGLPVSGVWRFGLKGKHRHLYTARKAAMVSQGDGGGVPLPEWVQALGDEDWLYGTWDEEKKEMRLYRSLSNMLNVLVPPVEHEQFGDRTFARAIAAVQGALSELAEGEEAQEGQAPKELEYEYEGGEAKAAEEPAEAARPEGRELEKPAVVAAERRMKRLTEKAGAKKQKGLEEPAVVAAERRMQRLAEQAPEKKAPAKKVAAKKAPAKKAPAKKASVKKAPAKKAAAKKAPAKKAPAKKAPAKKAPAKKAPAKKAPAKKAPAKKAPAKKATVKKAGAKKAGAKKATGARRKR